MIQENIKLNKYYWEWGGGGVKYQRINYTINWKVYQVFTPAVND